MAGFKQNTDTVPAMLTPGEFVIRKEAVDQLGKPFLESLNQTGGGHIAIDELIALGNMPTGFQDGGEVAGAGREYAPGTVMGTVDSSAVMRRLLGQIGTDRDYRNLLKKRHGETLGQTHIDHRVEIGDMLDQEKINEVLKYFMSQDINEDLKGRDDSDGVKKFQYGGAVTGGQSLESIYTEFGADPIDKYKKRLESLYDTSDERAQARESFGAGVKGVREGGEKSLSDLYSQYSGGQQGFGAKNQFLSKSGGDIREGYQSKLEEGFAGYKQNISDIYSSAKADIFSGLSDLDSADGTTAVWPRNPEVGDTHNRDGIEYEWTGSDWTEISEDG